MDNKKGDTFDVTFTKWITSAGAPGSGILFNMAGIVDGDVGAGTYQGEVISANDNGTDNVIQAHYHMHGNEHSFTANVRVTESNTTGMATITGRVIDGWLESASVTGEYKTLATCEGNPSGPCYQGALHIQRPPEH